ncbi:hypothetical protein GRI39_00075 [Altererythrobacter indicus]|uniref:Alpha/beta hydrolase domain-containing protein n=1 Tax=Altericroceibacterium indicum TaxID=374177 RepID=A0A845A7B0_9SPHN|nr:alpha/beta hydrolase domain-containing protein [Altericroceibacterium indicum]MXP24446.1 hypothetical protein [Altericroceibacterium indicum]
MKTQSLNTRILRLTTTAICAVPLLPITATPAVAKTTRIVIESREDAPAQKDGAPEYEILKGRAYGELDPEDPTNAIITDIQFAPRNTDGKVEYSNTFVIAKPKNMAQSSGVIFYDVPNRGNGAVHADPDGNIQLISGWQGDLPTDRGLQTLTVPIARRADGTALTTPVLNRFSLFPKGKNTLPITGSIGLPTSRPAPVSLDTTKAKLFRQSADDQPLNLIPSSDWAFADCEKQAFPGTADPAKICLKGGFDPAYAYTLVYQGKDPKVLGIGFAATRDLVSFLRRDSADDAGHPNPLGKPAQWAVASGTSQSGNYLRSFVNLGFNGDEAGRIVFDAINPNIAARQVPLNLRFGVPGGAAGLFEPGSEGTLWWASYDDQPRGRGVSSLLDRCHANGTCPKVMETFGSAEFWGLRMSPNLVGTDTRADIPLPDNVRRYYFPSVTHGGSPLGGFSTDGEKIGIPGDLCQMPGNPNPSGESLHAAWKAMIAWATEGKAPPPSRYPMLANGDLVQPTARAMGWPAIPGEPTADGKINIMPDYDFGDDLDYNSLSGVLTKQPPAIRQIIPQLVPRVNADGNETVGIPSVQLQVPLGTYTGWNMQQNGYGKGGGCFFIGGFIPFAKTKAERQAKGDPRLSLEERYGDHAGFVQKVKEAVARQQASGWLLPDDARKLIAEAKASTVLK